MQLVIKESELDLKIIKRIKQSLKRKFNNNSSNDIDKVVELANYLVAMQLDEEARVLLESFVIEIEHQDGREDLWGSLEQGRVLLSFLYKKEGKLAEGEKLLEVFLTDDMIGDKNYVYQRYLEDREEYQSTIDYAMTETHKYRCSIIGQEILTFMYYNEILTYFQEVAPKLLEEDLGKLIARTYKLLEKNLKN